MALERVEARHRGRAAHPVHRRRLRPVQPQAHGAEADRARRGAELGDVVWARGEAEEREEEGGAVGLRRRGGAAGIRGRRGRRWLRAEEGGREVRDYGVEVVGVGQLEDGLVGEQGRHGGERGVARLERVQRVAGGVDGLLEDGGVAAARAPGAEGVVRRDHEGGVLVYQGLLCASSVSVLSTTNKATK